MTTCRLEAYVSGHVQGVGFRAWVRDRADSLGLVGSARNLADGRVEVVAEGPRTAADRLLEDLRGPRTPGRVDTVEPMWSDAEGSAVGFRIG